MKMLLFLALILCWTRQALSQSGDNDTQCFSTPTGELEITARVHGVPGLEGPKGEQGDKGSIGPSGPKGDTGLKGKRGDRSNTGPMGHKERRERKETRVRKEIEASKGR